VSDIVAGLVNYTMMN